MLIRDFSTVIPPEMCTGIRLELPPGIHWVILSEFIQRLLLEFLGSPLKILIFTLISTGDLSYGFCR